MAIRKAKNTCFQIHSFLPSVTLEYTFTYPIGNTEGIIKCTLSKRLPTDKQPSYSQVCRRTNKLDITSNRLDDDDESIIIAIDRTGIKVTNIGQWMQDKLNIGKRGYLKIHFAVDINTRELLALEVTDEKLHDEKIMEQSVEQVFENKNIKIKSILADDGAYDSHRNFKYLQKKKIQPGIKVNKNSIISCKNNKIRNREVSSQIKDLSQ